jgi:hypothetical protein
MVVLPAMAEPLPYTSKSSYSTEVVFLRLPRPFRWDSSVAAFSYSYCIGEKLRRWCRL